MLTLLKISALVGLTIFAPSCATDRAVIIDSQSDVIRIGPATSGNVYVYKNGEWILVKKVIIPEGWYAGPMPAEK